MIDSARPSVVLSHRRPGGEVEVVLAGRLDLRCVGRPRDAVLLASLSAGGRVAVETSRVTAVDGVGLRTLIACRRLAAALGVQMVLERPSRPLLARLSQTGLLRTFKVSGALPAPDDAAASGSAPDRQAAAVR
jgi:anti-anti-sigma regulatory factor